MSHQFWEEKLLAALCEGLTCKFHSPVLFIALLLYKVLWVFSVPSLLFKRIDLRSAVCLSCGNGEDQIQEAIKFWWHGAVWKL